MNKIIHIEAKDNECWAWAMALATREKLETIKDLFKPFVESDGALREGFIQGYLCHKGFNIIATNDTLQNIISTYDSHRNHIVCSAKNGKDFHVVYLECGMVNDNVKLVGDMVEYFNQTIERIYIKRKENYYG